MEEWSLVDVFDKRIGEPHTWTICTNSTLQIAHKQAILTIGDKDQEKHL